MSVDTVSLTGWGRTAPTTAVRFRPRTYEEAAAVVRGRGPRGALARGLGRAPGDAAQNAGGSVLDMTGLDRVRALDEEAATVRCDAGVTLDRLLRILLSRGLFLPVVPGSGRITVGGAIGSDVHGLDHPGAGSLARHVDGLELLTADGEVRTVTPGTALFDATTGGLGLTGVILSATLRLKRVVTPLVSVSTERATGLDDLLARFTAGRGGPGDPLPYASAWIDLLARGRATGRGVLTRGEHAPPSVLPAHARRMMRAPRTVQPDRHPIGPLLPGGLLGRTAAALLNEVRYRSAPRSRTGELRTTAAFFHPLDALPDANRLYGRAGLVRYRFTVGYGQEEALHRVVRRISARRCPAFRAELQRFGAAGTGLLSFPAPGWTLALDLPAALPGLARFLDGLDDEVAAAGGRVCLAQDSRMRPETAAAMYPGLGAFRELRAELDPTGAFRSDLARRLAL
ncbi:FAD-binding oxidoreductase [Streptomyces sp. ISL-112]|uniref:FAD-binding protein n=1 Tax=unclassified Streptomyces TaxID=2593676 RepID=UPI001BE7CA7D|nr:MULTISPECIES: FAD-binding oxidoreductase [unclassified Streptomyces]MBT2424595.1 FAD-binding oxidoreductase [Streptomyces sp. ISL-112]MBT2465130.1 FAD-binding oxidoreductase [Streptomyces sp. ISL-63]